MARDFRYYLRVRYGECDAQKVVFNARYGEYIDLAVSEYLRSLGYGEELVNGELDYQLVKQSIEWKSPARYDQVLEVSVKTVRLGNTSFTLNAVFRIAGSDDVISSAETVYVLMEPGMLRKRTLPRDLRASLERGSPGLCVDHAAFLGSNQASRNECEADSSPASPLASSMRPSRD